MSTSLRAGPLRSSSLLARHPIAGASALAVSAAVIGIVACEVAAWPFLRGPVERQLTKALAVPVSLDGRFQARFLWNKLIAADHLRIGAAKAVPVPHLLDARGVALRWRWRDLLAWRDGDPLRLQELRADVLDAHLARLADGRASWQLGAPKAEAPPKDEDAASSLPTFGLLTVGAGRITFDDRIVDTRLQVDITGSEGDIAVAAGGPARGLRATAAGNYKDLKLQLRASAAGALPLAQDDADGTPAPPVPVRVEGTAGASEVLFDGTLSALLGARRLDGALRFAGPSLAQVGEPLGLTLPRTPAFELIGRLQHDGGVWRLVADSASIGRSRLKGDFRYDARAKPGLLSGRLTGPLLALADLGPSVGTPGEGKQPIAAKANMPASRRVLPDRKLDLPSLRAMNADVQVAITELDLGTQALAPLRNLQTRVVLEAGVLELQALKAVVAGGNISGTTRLDATQPAARWSADLNFNALDVAGWIRGLRTPAAAASAPSSQNAAGLKRERTAARQGGARPVDSYVTGELRAHVKVAGAGRSTAEILSSLDGRADAVLRDGTLSHLLTEAAGIDIAQALGVLVRGDQPLPLRCARFELPIKDGVMQAQNVVFDSADSTVRIDGQIDLGTETMALRAVTKPKDFSPLTLRVPVLVGGTFGAPTVGVDAKQAIGKAVAAIALGVIAAPAAALLPLIDPGSRSKDDPCASPAVAAVETGKARSAK